MKIIEIKAPAKINIGLNIVQKRPDGFHNLETFFYPLRELYDTLIFEKSDKFQFNCDSNFVPSDDSNLAVKAVKLLENKTSSKLPVKIDLIKRIPAGAGLGGGSSDAAAVLISLNEMFKLNLDQSTLNEIALILGSDVPFFIKAKPAIGRSRGEDLTFVNVEINNPILVVNPGIHISTKEAFSNITPSPSDFDYSYFINKSKIDFAELKENLKNDFELFSFSKHPEIRIIKEMLVDNGALLSLMSGTGSTVFGIFENFREAELASQNLPESYFKFISFAQN